MKKFILFILCSFVFSISYADHAEQGEMKLGFMPYLGTQHLIQKYQPLADYLSKELGVKVMIEVAKDYETHSKNTGEDKLDISFLGGSPYISVVEKYGAKPLLARYEFDGKPYFRSVFYTSEKNGINSIGDLAGKKVAFGSKKSTLTAQVPMYMLMEGGLTKSDITYSFVDNQENVALGVMLGEFDAGSAAEEIFNENRKMGLRAIAYSPYVSTHVFVASSKMSREMQEKVRKALFTLKDKPGGKEILQSISGTLTGFVDVADSDYDLLRKILKQVKPELE